VVDLRLFSTIAGEREEHCLTLKGDLPTSSERAMCEVLWEIENNGRVSDLRKDLLSLEPRTCEFSHKSSYKCAHCKKKLSGSGARWQCALCPPHVTCDACFTMHEGGIQGLEEEPKSGESKSKSAPSAGHLLHHPFYRFNSSNHTHCNSEFDPLELSLLPDYYRTGLAKHHDTTCNSCRQSPIRGSRFKSVTSADVDLCARCYTALEQGSTAEKEGEVKGQEFKGELFLHVPDSSLIEGLDDEDDGDETCQPAGPTLASTRSVTRNGWKFMAPSPA
jgi:hypothetical protein